MTQRPQKMGRQRQQPSGSKDAASDSGSQAESEWCPRHFPPHCNASPTSSAPKLCQTGNLASVHACSGTCQAELQLGDPSEPLSNQAECCGTRALSFEVTKTRCSCRWTHAHMVTRSLPWLSLPWMSEHNEQWSKKTGSGIRP